MSDTPFFLPYQVRWLEDQSRIKIWQKSRRIGASYACAYEDVEDCVANRVPAAWYSTTDKDNAKEYIRYCAFFAKALNIFATDLGEVVIDEKKNITAHSLSFENGNRIYGLSSSPTAFRGKGGKVTLDEFAFHEDDKGLWAAAQPTMLWGYPLRILSTHNGTQTLYYKFIQEILEGKKRKFSLHTTDIFKAVEEGLADKICGRKLTDQERVQWIEDLREFCGNELVFNQEYCCIAVDEATTFFTYDLITSCESSNTLYDSLDNMLGYLYVGMDIARVKDLSVIWVAEKLGEVLYTRKVIILEKMLFRHQKEVLYSILRHPNVLRACIDSTGIGMNLAEDAMIDFGKQRVEMVHFTAPVKEDLVLEIKNRMDDRQVVLPERHDIREDFHSIQKFMTAAGNVRYDSAKTDNGVIGHADRFWAAALAVHAAKGTAPIDNKIVTGAAPESASIIDMMY